MGIMLATSFVMATSANQLISRDYPKSLIAIKRRGRRGCLLPAVWSFVEDSWHSKAERHRNKNVKPKLV